MTMREVYVALKHINSRAVDMAEAKQKELSLHAQFHGWKIDFPSISKNIDLVKLTQEQEALANQAIERVKARKAKEAQLLNGRQ